jgi:hypothetical protein
VRSTAWSLATGLLLALGWIVSRAEGPVAVADGGVGDAARPRNDAGEEGLETITIKVGKPAELRLGFVCIQSICDDEGIVRVEDGGDHLRLVGLAEGATRCGFWRDKSPYPHRLIRVVVTPDKPPPRRRDGGVR